MGIPAHSTVSMVMASRRRRHHRIDIFDEVETLIDAQREKLTLMQDQALWTQNNDTFKPVFKTKLTWEKTRKHEPPARWRRAVWFQHCTPKYAFIHWVAIQNRLSTGDKMLAWNASTNPSCILCQAPMETREHLFFECSYSSEVWSLLMSGLLQGRYSTKWS